MTSQLAQSIKDAKISAIQQVIDPLVIEAVDLAVPDATAAALVNAAVSITNASIVRAILTTRHPGDND